MKSVEEVEISSLYEGDPVELLHTIVGVVEIPVAPSAGDTRTETVGTVKNDDVATTPAPLESEALTSQ